MALTTEYYLRVWMDSFHHGQPYFEMVPSYIWKLEQFMLTYTDIFFFPDKLSAYPT